MNKGGSSSIGAETGTPSGCLATYKYSLLVNFPNSLSATSSFDMLSFGGSESYT